jgi:hypothetical protein
MANTLRFKRGLASGIPTAVAGEPLFTTDTFDLYIGNGTTNTRFQKYIASGTSSQLLRGDGSLLTMPIVLTSPSNGQVLKYNGTNWVNDSDAGVTGNGATGQVAYWNGTSSQTGSNNLFWDAANSRLGVGTTSPQTNLHVSTAGSVSGRFSNTTSGVNTEIGVISGLGYVGTQSAANFAIITSDTERARFTTAGRLLLGTTTESTFLLDVNGTARVSGALTGNTGSFSSTMNADSYGLAGAVNALAWTLNTLRIGQGTYWNNIELWDGSTIKIKMFSGGNLLLQNGGTFTDAGYRLDVNGTARVSGEMTVNGIASLGISQTTTLAYIGDFNTVGTRYIRFSRASALSNIVNIQGVNGGVGADNIALQAEGGNVGIGTSSPAAKLHVDDGAGAALYIGLGTYNYYRAYEHIWQSLNGTFQRMSISSVGNLLVNTSVDAGFKLDVNGTARVTGNTLISAGNLSIFTTNTPRRINLEVANGSKAAAIGIQTLGVIHSVIGVDTSGTDFLQVASKTGISFYSGSTIGNIVTDPTNERMRLTTAGRLLLGTTTESTFLLDVNGTARVSDTSATILTLNSTNGTGYSAIKIDASGVEKGLIGFGTYLTSDGGVAIRTAASTPFTIAIGGGVPTLTLATTGAATFSSSVKAGGGSINASAILQADSTTQGFLPPRMTTTQKNAIGTPAQGLMVFDTTLVKLCVYNGTTWETITSL